MELLIEKNGGIIIENEIFISILTVYNFNKEVTNYEMMG